MNRNPSTDPPELNFDRRKLLPPDEVTGVLVRLRERGFSAFLVGGALRNAILGLQIEDWDVATEASWQVVMSMFPKVIPTGVRHGTVTVVLGPVRVEVSSFKGDGILDDLGHRDFTIDAMAWDPVSDSLMDPHGGMRDLKARVVRGVGDPAARLEEDPLRAIRAFRICAELGFRIHRGTMLAIARAARGIERVSPERIRYELTRVLLSPDPLLPLRGMSKTGLLHVVLPELTGSSDAAPSGPSRRLERAFRIFEGLPNRAPLRWAALLRSVRWEEGTPRDRGTEGHEGTLAAKALIAREVLRRLRFSRRDIRCITHMISSMDLLDGVEPSEIAARRLVSRIGHEWALDVLALRRAELMASKAPDRDLAWLSELEGRVTNLVRPPEAAPLRPVLTGFDVMKILGIPPGPRVGQILRCIQELLIQDPSANSRGHLEEWLRRECASMA